MHFGFLKSLALKLVSYKVSVPEASLERFNELVYLKRLLERLDINCVIDVGANRGQFAHEIRAIGYTGHIVSFEPVEREYAALSSSFGSDPKWSGHRIALGSENKSTSINVPKMSVLSSLLEFEEGGTHTESQPVSVRRLDEMFPQVTKDIPAPRVFLKMDTQGFDLEVFKGAEGCIDLVQGMQSEVSVLPLYRNMPHYIESLSSYENKGFKLDNLTVVNREDSGGIIEMNAFMTR